MIHVLHVLGCLRLGGAERVIGDLVAKTDKQRFRHTVCYLHPPHELADQLRESGCEVIFLDAPERRGWLSAASKLRTVIRSVRPDILHTATFDANLSARLGGFRKKVPQLSWLVSMDYDPDSVRAAGWSRLSNTARRCLDIITARYAGDRFVACSSAVMRSAIQRLHISPANIEVIYNPVSRDTVSARAGEAAELRRCLQIPDWAFVYFTVGRMDLPKGHEFLLSALDRLSSTQPDSHLVILGNGPLQEVLPRRAREIGISDRVRFIASAPSIAPYLDLADVFVFPSLLEGLPVALLEAMCAGLPCIASDIEPHVEVISPGNTGLLFQRGSVEDLAKAMDEMFADEALRRRLGAAARHYAERRFMTEVIVPQWESAYLRAAQIGG